MAFANLFTRLSVVEEDVKSPGKPAFTHRNETDNGKRGNGRKRKTQGEQAGSYKKKRCYQAQTTRTYNATSFKDDDSEAIHCHMQNTDSEHASDGFTKEVKHNHRNKAGYNNMCHKGQNCKTKNNRNVNKQQQQKKETERQKNQHQQKDRCRPANRGGSHQTRPTRNSGWGSKNKNDKQDFQVKRTRFMTQEFKDQNALLVDGRLLCRHFIWGRCIKGDDCQLEHIQGYNNLVKEVCKFYVQGLCTKGESCPYMHKSFPCKFFHRKGKCSQGADCRFSHEPLNDVTNQLLDEALKRENDLYELAKKAEQESSGQPANTDESEIINANTTPDILIQPLRPNFYKSTDTNAEEALCQTEELADIMEGAVPSHASNAVQPHGTPSTNLNHEEPVCYSVEAVLGPQLSKPFPSFFTTPGSQESAPLSSSDCTPGSAYQSEVPYSVDAVLRSCKSVGNSTVGHTCTPPTAQTVSYTPKSYFEENTDPLLNSETQNEKVLYSVNTRNENNKSQTTKMFKSQLSLQMHTGWISKTCPNLTLSSGDHIKQGNEDSSTEHINQPTKQLVNPVCSLVSNSLSERSTSPTPCGNSPSTTHAYQTLPDISSHKGSAVAATANSVLKTLFLCLSPYQQDGEHQDSIQIIVPSESEKQDKSSTGCVFVKQQRKGKKKGSRKKKLKTQDSHKKSTEKTVAHSTEHQLMLQTHQISLEATGGSTLSSPGMTESQVRNSGTHNLPFKPVVPLMQHHTRPRLKHTSEEGKWVNGNVAATPLKDLFKTLDTTVFHFGH
ncbi:zinc finger CCCH domain-containing protein 6-like isoform X3 [Siniperca chuatsi]|uniref:zinc finger CCCH domain-containing protein 6-like isoform X3 n=1 Tax=Siniperca chuatsi TaxID=119488 RepID=UPI001CE11CE7|nr:zinc finger CCCH domain-containing protein 6-like isoform X3 [Siniperca chuatsi]